MTRLNLNHLPQYLRRYLLRPTPKNTPPLQKTSPLPRVQGNRYPLFNSVLSTDGTHSSSIQSHQHRLSFYSDIRNQHPLTYVSSHVESRKVPKNKVKQLLFYVARGMQNEAELMLAREPALATVSMQMTDYSSRFFIAPALIYARWARDWHMCRMLIKYMDPKEAQDQLAHLEAYGTTHGKQFEFTELTSTLETYLNNFDNWSCHQLGIQWCKAIGMAQTRAVAHVAHQFCHPHRSFFPHPDFESESVLPRNLILADGSQFFPLAPYSAGTLGRDFAVFRWNKSAAGIGTMKPCNDARITAIVDLQAIRLLEAACINQCLRIEEEVGYFRSQAGLKLS